MESMGFLGAGGVEKVTGPWLKGPDGVSVPNSRNPPAVPAGEGVPMGEKRSQAGPRSGKFFLKWVSFSFKKSRKS